MTKLPRLNPRQVLSALLRAGFYIHHQSGSHINLRHNAKEYLHVVVPHHNRDLAPKTLKSIVLQSGLTTEEFIKLF